MIIKNTLSNCLLFNYRIMSKRWLRYGLVGNFLSYGIGTLFIAYTGNKITI